MEARSGCRIGVVGGAHDDRARASTAGITRIHPGPPPITQDAAKPTQPTTGWGTPHTLLGAESVDHVEPHKDSSRFPHIRFPHGRSRPAHAPCTARTWHLLYGARGIHGSCTARTGGRLRPHGARPVQGTLLVRRGPASRTAPGHAPPSRHDRAGGPAAEILHEGGHGRAVGPCRWARAVRWRVVRTEAPSRAVADRAVADRAVAGRTGGGPYRWRAVRVAGRARWARVLRGGRGPCGWRGPFG